MYAGIVFVVQMEGMKVFVPNDNRHKAFGEALRSAKQSGIEVLAHECKVAPDTLTIGGMVPVDLNPSRQSTQI